MSFGSYLSSYRTLEVQDLLKAAPSNKGLGQESERIALLYNVVQLFQYYFNSKVPCTFQYRDLLKFSLH